MLLTSPPTTPPTPGTMLNNLTNPIIILPVHPVCLIQKFLKIVTRFKIEIYFTQLTVVHSLASPFAETSSRKNSSDCKKKHWNDYGKIRNSSIQYDTIFSTDWTILFFQQNSSRSFYSWYARSSRVVSHFPIFNITFSTNLYPNQQPSWPVHINHFNSSFNKDIETNCLE